MSGFSTEALLYPLTKGDKTGHSFHGNQYREVASEGGQSRPPAGKLQLSFDEMKELGKQLADTNDWDGVTVGLSKKLGVDKPATRISGNLDVVDYYRGCDKAGAESLTQPLVHYGQDGGTALGHGAYFSPYEEVAEQYKKDTMIEALVDPSAKIAHEEDLSMGFKGNGDTGYAGNLLPSNQREEYDKLPKEQQEALNEYCSQPSNTALLLGYQGYYDDLGETMVVLDRSILKVAY